jgi:asparagine synthase (glutamine-hydrolysing)
VHLYEEFGVDCVLKVDTEMFAVIIYDIKKQEYYVTRDRLGVKPLYY